jgi:hypothetical protein
MSNIEVMLLMWLIGMTTYLFVKWVSDSIN